MRTRATPWGRVETCRQRVIYFRAAGPPLFWGGRSRLSRLPASEAIRAASKAANHGGMRHIEESGFAALLVFRMNVTPPPLSRVTIF